MSGSCSRRGDELATNDSPQGCVPEPCRIATHSSSPSLRGLVITWGRASPLRCRGGGTDERSLLRRVSRHEADDGEPERPKTVVDPTGIPETVCPPIEHDLQTAVTPEDASQLGVSGGFVSRDHHEPPGDGPTPAPCPLSRRWHRGSRHSPSPHSGALDHFRYSSVMVPSSFSTTR